MITNISINLLHEYEIINLILNKFFLQINSVNNNLIWTDMARKHYDLKVNNVISNSNILKNNLTSLREKNLCLVNKINNVKI